jgi:hypothetical protein
MPGLPATCPPDRSGPAFSRARSLRAGPRCGGIAATNQTLPNPFVPTLPPPTPNLSPLSNVIKRNFNPPNFV